LVSLRDDELMWTYLPQWLIQDGQVDELAAGSSLLATAVAASCREVMPVGGSRSAGVVRAELGADGYWYDVTGMAGAVGDVLTDRGDGRSVRVGSEFLLTSGALRFTARTTDFFVDEVVGSMVTARCSLEVVADYEGDAFDLLGFRQDWSVESVQIERRVLNKHMIKGLNGRVVAGGRAGDRMRKWADDPAVAPESTAAETTMRYVVDLRLLRPKGQQP